MVLSYNSRADLGDTIVNIRRYAWLGELTVLYATDYVPDEMMIERIGELKADDPGEGWDGVYRATSK